MLTYAKIVCYHIPTSSVGVGATPCLLQFRTLPAGVAGAGLVAGLAVAPLWVATVGLAVGHLARLPLPLVLALALHRQARPVTGATLATPRTVIRARVHPGEGERGRGGRRRQRQEGRERHGFNDGEPRRRIKNYFLS